MKHIIWHQIIASPDRRARGTDRWRLQRNKKTWTSHARVTIDWFLVVNAQSTAKVMSIIFRAKYKSACLGEKKKSECTTKGENPGRRRSMKGFILTYSRLLKKNVWQLWVLCTWNLNVCIRGHYRAFCPVLSNYKAFFLTCMCVFDFFFPEHWQWTPFQIF